MTPGARLSAAMIVLDDIFAGTAVDAALSGWGRANRFAGSGDRYAIRDLVFDALRRKRSFSALGGSMTGRGVILGGTRASGASEGEISELFSGQGHAPSPIGPADQARVPSAAEALDAPDWLISVMREDLGAQHAQILSALTARAPVFLRANPLRSSPLHAAREVAQAKLAEAGVNTQLMQNLKYGLQVTGAKRKINKSPAYQTGLVELQDAASQAVIEAIDLPKTGRVLDYCAGGGGKTLSLAAHLGHNTDVSVFAYDAHARRMADLPARAARANAQIKILDNPKESAPFDLILTDVPCSGSGSWRRDPMGKWSLSGDKLTALQALQAQILDQAADLTARGGTLAYTTCSVLLRENETQIAAFLRRRPDFHCAAMQRFGLGEIGSGVQKDFSSTFSGGDGFFLAVLRAK